MTRPAERAVLDRDLAEEVRIAPYWLKDGTDQ